MLDFLANKPNYIPLINMDTSAPTSTVCNADCRYSGQGKLTLYQVLQRDPSQATWPEISRAINAARRQFPSDAAFQHYFHTHLDQQAQQADTAAWLVRDPKDRYTDAEHAVGKFIDSVGPTVGKGPLPQDAADLLQRLDQAVMRSRNAGSVWTRWTGWPQDNSLGKELNTWDETGASLRQDMEAWVARNSLEQA